jgi:hypothetical protein
MEKGSLGSVPLETGFILSPRAITASKTPKIDLPRSTEYVDAIRVLLVDDPYILQKWIAFILNIGESTVKRILYEDFSLQKATLK